MNDLQNVIFLDIDGVLQPDISRMRFDVDRKALQTELAEKFQDDEYLKISDYDLAAVYYDWSPDAVNYLRLLLDNYKAKIVLSTNWKEFNSIEIMKKLFRIHNLDQYIIGCTPNRLGGRAKEIQKYIEENNESISNFIVLDDSYKDELSSSFKDRFVYCRSSLGEEEYLSACAVLK